MPSRDSLPSGCTRKVNSQSYAAIPPKDRVCFSHSSKCFPVTPTLVTPPTSFSGVMNTSCSGRRYGPLRSRMPLMTLKTAVVAPMPREKEKIAIREKPGVFNSCRQAKRRSLSMVFGDYGGTRPRYDEFASVLVDNKVGHGALAFAVVAPMPRAKEKIAIRENPGVFNSCRQAKRRSLSMVFGDYGGTRPRYDEFASVLVDNKVGHGALA